jgi:hypothetical protein
MIADETILDGASSEAIAVCDRAYSLPVMRMSSLDQTAAWFPVRRTHGRRGPARADFGGSRRGHAPTRSHLGL